MNGTKSNVSSQSQSFRGKGFLRGTTEKDTAGVWFDMLNVGQFPLTFISGMRTHDSTGFRDLINI